MITTQRVFGNCGEEATCQWLINHGFAILARNYQTRCGEVDIIAQKAEVISFVEVKTRKEASFCIGATITKTKQQRIGRAASSFILGRRLKNHIFRFDVMIVTGPRPEEYQFHYIPNAFTIV